MSDTAPVDIGHGLTAALRLSEGFPDLEDGVPVGVLLTHPCAMRGGELVQDFIPVHSEAAALSEQTSAVQKAIHWTLQSREPITVSPSIQYTCCGLHGFIRGGKWVPA